jgi:hypothetical protein
VENWTVQRVTAVSPTDGSDCDAAYLLSVSYGEEQAQVIVEFAAPSSVPSGAYAEEVVGPYLRQDEPPQRLVVERDGTVRVASGPLAADRVPRRTIAPREPQRGRRRGHR